MKSIALPAERPHQRGFTLIELMITMSLLAVLISIAAPGVQEMIATARLKSHNGAIQTSLMLARSEAIKRKVRVVACKSADGGVCTTTGNWEQGWIVFVDSNDNGGVDINEPILQKVGQLRGSFILTGDGNLVDYVSFTSSGSPKETASETLQSGIFTLCMPSSTKARQTQVSATGRLSFGAQPVSSCTST